ncbi:MAG: recombinase family protein, partial [Ruthenibacterium sp.]
MMNAVIYARFSSYKQHETSIEGQLQECYAYAERNNITVINEYIDRATTGKNDKRPSFQKMMVDSEKKQFDIILVYQLDRFARSRADSALYKRKLSKCDVHVVSARENISNDASGILVEGMLESMAEYFSVELSQ